jgi:putative nucleotidyltransferase with HDIG domain
LKMMRLVNEPEVPFSRLADLVRIDPAFSSELLTVVNSASMGCRARIFSIQHALALVGLERLKSLALTVALRNFVAERIRIPILRRCWLHSVASAVLAEELAAACRQPKDAAYTAGLLHDLGRLGLLVSFPIEYARMLEEAQKGAVNVIEREKELFGADHCVAGQMLAEKCKLPEQLQHIIMHHHDAEPAEPLDTTAVVELACRLANILGYPAAGPVSTATFEDMKEAFPSFPWQALGGRDPMLSLRRKVSSYTGTF